MHNFVNEINIYKICSKKKIKKFTLNFNINFISYFLFNDIIRFIDYITSNIILFISNYIILIHKNVIF